MSHVHSHNDESPSDATARLLPILLTPQLSVAEIELTTACPCRCVTCGSNCGRAAVSELTADELTRIISDLHALGCQRVTFLGGEPLCRPDLMTLIRHARGLRLMVELVTSAMGLDAAVAQELKNAGINTVTVSVDGLEASHDAQRAVNGSYCRALEAIRALRAARVPVAVNTQLNRLSLPDLDALGDQLLQAGAMGWQLQTTLPMGRAAQSSLILQPADMPELLNVVRRLSRRPRLAPQLTDATGWCTSDDTRLRSVPGVMARCWLGCSAGTHHMGITSQGDVKGCLALPNEFTEGNVRDETLREIWADPKRFAHNRTYRPESLSGSCATCTQATLCRGGCMASAVSFHGQPGRNDNCLLLVEQNHA